jgi:hypothetical protein
MPKLSKIEAARRQLDCAIRLYFDNDDEVDTQIGIGFAAMLYRHITATLTPEMKAFHLWMKVGNPEHFHGVREPDWEFEQEYLDANEVLKIAPREVRVITGKVLLQLLKAESPQKP